VPERQAPTSAIVLGAVAALSTVLLVLSPAPLSALLGPAALASLPIVLGLAAASSGLRWVGYPSLTDAVGIAARVGAWVLLWRLVTDPAPNLVDAAADLGGYVLGHIGAGIRMIVMTVLGLVILAFVVALLFGGPSSPPTATAKTTVRTGSTMGPVAAGLLRIATRLSLALVVLGLWLFLLAAAWTLLGIAGPAVAVGRREPVGRPDAAIVRLAGWLARVSAGLSTGLRRRSARWGHQEALGAWLSPVAIERGPAGELLQGLAWQRDASEGAEERELRELTSALVAAYDVALMAGAGAGARKGANGQPEGGQDPRQPAPRPHPYRIEAVRAWSRPGFHAVVVRATPTTANAILAKVPADTLLPTLDAETSWTMAELKGLRLSDRRVADDPLRGGEPGVFIALERQGSVVEPAPSTLDDGQRAIARALREAGYADRFRLTKTDIGFDADTYEYRASFATSAEWRELEGQWKSLAPAVALFARESGVRLETRLDPYAFMAVIPKPTPEFPSGEATDWGRVVARYEPILRKRPLSFVLGLDYQGEPLIMALSTETPHLLVAGSTGSGKSRSAVFSPLAQLLRTHEPARLRLWLLDSVKREVTSLFGDAPHVERSVIAEDGDQVVAMLEAFTASMDARYRVLAGREFDPHREAAHLIILEEFADQRDLLDRDQLERVIRAMNRIGQIGRAAGHHAILVTQKASAEVIPPRLKTNFKGRIGGFLPQASDYGILFDQHRRLLPNVKGRLAVASGDGMIRIVQGLYVDNDAIRRLIDDLQAKVAPRPAPIYVAPAIIEPVEPRAPTAREVEGLDLLTLARVIYRWQAEAGSADLVVSVRPLVERVRALGHTPGRLERYTAGLGELEGLGVLARVGDGPQSSRRIALSWDEARRRIVDRPTGWR
jgi:hypothetical protein